MKRGEGGGRRREERKDGGEGRRKQRGERGREGWRRESKGEQDVPLEV